jgi:diguanylate cyclase (GGDEF)-like protein/PAS domain S-box-containing protein
VDHDLVAPPDVPGAVADAFVFRRVAPDRFAHVGGVGRGEGWAGIVTLVTGETADTRVLPAAGHVQVVADEAPRQRFGPYWSAFLVLVRLDHDLVVAFGGPQAVEAEDATWRDAARSLADQLTHVTPAKRLADELELLHAVRDIALIPPGGVAEVGAELLERLTRALSCEVGALELPDGGLQVHVGDDTVDEGIARLALRGLLEEHRGRSACEQDASTLVGGGWMRSYLVRPVGEEAAVVLAHTAAAPRGFTDLCQGLADSTTAAAATVLRAAQQHEAVRVRAARASAEARSDALTGLANRRAWDEAVARHDGGADAPVAVILCDVDGLKDVNDQLGHAAGDRYLRAAADLLESAVRDGDLVARLGGDEFVLMLPGADDDQAGAVVERIQRACRATETASGPTVSLSLGVAVGRGGELTDLLEHADATMYRRKRTDAPPEEAISADVVQPVVGEILRVLLHLPPDRVDEGIQHALRALGQALELDRTYVFSIGATSCINTHEWCAPGVPPEIDDCQDLPVSMMTDWLEAFRQGRRVVVHDVASLAGDHQALHALLSAQGIRSLLLVPMTFEGEAVGFVGFAAVGRRRVFGEVAQGLLTSVADVVAAAQARRHAGQRVERAERRAAEMLRHSRDHVFLVDADARIAWASDSFLQLGATPDELVGRPAVELTHPDDHDLISRLVAAWLQSDSTADLVLPDHRTVIGGQTRWMSVVLRDARSRPGVDGIIVAGHDVTQRRDQTERLRRLALHDHLTGLPNRALLKDRLQVALQRAVRTGSHVGVLFLGVDGFKVVNDSRSHAVGDEMLRQVAERLRGHVRAAETAGRFGGDQFVVVIEADDVEEIQRAVERLTGIFDTPFTVSGQPQTMSASFGLRVADVGEADPDAVLRDADNALFAAKARGRGRLVAFDPRMRERAVRHDRVLQRLPDAIAQGLVVPHYQPIVDLATGRTIGAEALARWDDPELGAVSPAEFIPVAEQAGVIGALGTHVLRTACADAAGWREEMHVSVNLSPSQLEDAELCLTVSRALADAGLAPDRLVLEITESLLMQDTACAATHLRQLRAMGVRVALDDFGTGHSSLAVLRDLPLDVLKIDRSFVVRMQQDDRGARMVDGIVSLAQDLGLVTVAEGVETEDQATLLRGAGCDVAQGWQFGYPIPAAAFRAEATTRGATRPS